tara:strand:- start:3213 stop:5138 length:1926 start_codon:yes stop_codon:yes gene_type:complete
MAINVQIKYFNSFWLKKVCPELSPTQVVETKIPSQNPNEHAGGDYYAGIGQWPGLPWTPTYINPTTGLPVSYPPYAWYAAYIEAGIGLGVMQGVGAGASDYHRGSVHWYIEESCFKGGFNNNRLSLGVRAYTVDENPVGQNRSFSLIHSGILNTRSGYNETNVFSVSNNIEKDLEQINGTIEQLYIQDTLLYVFQEAKVNKVLINKNALYSGDQGSQDNTNNSFFGQLNPFAGEYGISKHGDTFAQFGYRKYFTDRDRGVVCRLSMDGITEISSYGMRDWFRDHLAAITNGFELITSDVYSIGFPDPFPSPLTFKVNTENCNIPIGSIISFINDDLSVASTNNFVTNAVGSNPAIITMNTSYTPSGNEDGVIFGIYKKPRIIGGWDIHNQNYVVSLQKPPSSLDVEGSYNTLSFDETVQGWVSFYSYRPLFVASLKNNFYSFYDCGVYEHYFSSTALDKNYGKFYGDPVPVTSNITFIFNPAPTVTKNFKTIEYEGSNGWEATVIVSDWQEYDPDSTWNIQPPTYANSVHFRDLAEPVLSYDEGFYIDQSGMPNHAGFVRKENQFVADIVNGNTIPRYDEVLYGEAINYPFDASSGASLGTVMSGIKGYVANVTLQIDTDTDPGGRKEIFSTASEFVLSSN